MTSPEVVRRHGALFSFPSDHVKCHFFVSVLNFSPRAAAAFVRPVPAGIQATCCYWERRAAAKRAGVSSAACSGVALWGRRLITAVR